MVVRVYITAICLFIACYAQAQLNDIDFSQYSFDEDTDYATLDPVALQVANLILDNPADKEPAARTRAGKFLLDWMYGTPDYTFGTGRIQIVLGEDEQVLAVLYAAQVKHALENQESINDNPPAIKAVWTAVAQYISAPENRIKLSPKLKELVQAYQSNRVQEFIEKHE